MYKYSLFLSLTHRSDDVAYECTSSKFSPIRFLYASEFNVDAANAVITKLKDPTKDANGMTLFDAHKRMGPCYDFGIAAAAAVAVCDNACLPPKKQCAVTEESKAKSQALSAELKAITGKWDGKAPAPLSDTQVCVCLCPCLSLCHCVNVCDCDCGMCMCVCTDAEVSGAQYQVMAEFVAWMKQLPSQVLLGG